MDLGARLVHLLHDTDLSGRVMVVVGRPQSALQIWQGGAWHDGAGLVGGTHGDDVVGEVGGWDRLSAMEKLFLFLLIIKGAENEAHSISFFFLQENRTLSQLLRE